MTQPLWASSLSGPPQTVGFLEKQIVYPETVIRPGNISLTAQEIDSIIFSRPDRVLRLPSLDHFTGNEQSGLEFTRFNIFAPNRQIRVISDDGDEFLEHDKRQYYLATNATTGIGISVNPDTGETRGFIKKMGSKLEISGNIIGQLQLREIEEPSPESNSCETGTPGQPLEIQQKLASPSFTSVSAAESGELISYEAVVAIETDSEWLDGFSDNTTAAMNWITDIFLAMNVFYERDVETHLLIGDVTLRTGSDPYTAQSDRSAQLDEFGAYWKDNMRHIDRQFAAMLSGRNISGGSFSGIAWIDQFCQDGRTWGSRTVGSFSYNAIGSSRSAGNTAIYLGHEIGHNMGSPHTHCYNPPVDHCYNGASGCYSGAPECPIEGKGTIMSYCHVGGSSGAGCGTSRSEFHPTVQSLIEANLADELAAGCILPYDQRVPEPEFNSSPPAGSTLDFGLLALNTRSAPIPILVQNLGDAVLTVSCALSGPDPGSFSINDCPLNLPAGGSSAISFNCTPTKSGSLSASVGLTTNDSSEGQVLFDLVCSGKQPANGDMIFSASFENDP
jgi:hypothetical protein